MVLRNVPITYTLDQQRQEINNLATDFNAVEVVFNNTQWDLAYGWGNHASAGYLTSLPAHTHAFTSLTDTPTTLTANKWLKVNSGGTAFEFTNAPTDIDTHLNQNNPTSGYVLSWNGSAYVWVAQTTDTVYTNSDVDTHLNQSNPTSGHVLSWNGSDYSWVAQTGGGGGSTTINNNADNRLITGSGTANTLEAESDLTYDGSTLTIGVTSSQVIVGSAGDLWAENALYVGDYSSPTISLYANGTASFGGGNTVLNTNGTGTFTNTVQSGGYPFQGTANGSALMSGSGCLASYENAASFLWRGYTTGNSTPTSSITAGGFATFSSTIQSKGNPMNGTAEGSQLAGDSGVVVCSNTGSQKIWRGFQGGTAAATSTITATGAATFAAGKADIDVNGKGRFGIIDGDNNVQVSDAGFYAYNANSATVQIARDTGNLTLQGYISTSAYISTTNNVWTGSRYANGEGVLLQQTGEISSRNDSTGATDYAWQGWCGGFGSGNRKSSITSSGNAYFAGGVSVGGTGAANTLDDYEEGTFIPTFSTQAGGTTTVSYTVQSGRYTKIGDTVHYYLQLQMAVTAWGSGEWLVSGLPFPCWSSYGNPPAQASRIYWYDGQNYTYQRQYVDYRWDHWWNQDKLFALVPSNGNSENDYRGTTATNLSWIVVQIHGTYFTN